MKYKGFVSNPIVNPCEAAKLPHFFCNFLPLRCQSKFRYPESSDRPQNLHEASPIYDPKIEQIFEKPFLKKVMGVQKYFQRFHLPKDFATFV